MSRFVGSRTRWIFRAVAVAIFGALVWGCAATATTQTSTSTATRSKDSHKNVMEALDYSGRALDAQTKGNYDEAIEEYTKAIQLVSNPSLKWNWYSSRADVYSKKKEYDKAIEDYSEAIRIAPEKDDDEPGIDISGSTMFLYINRGQAYENKEDYDGAITSYSEAINRFSPDKYPGIKYAYTSRGMVYSKKEDYDKAIADFSSAIRIAPKDFTSYFFRAVAYERKENYDMAIADYSEAMNHCDFPDCNIGYYIVRADVYVLKGDYDKAIADYEAVLKKQPNNNNARRALAEARLFRDNPQLAQQQQLLTTTPDDPAISPNPASNEVTRMDRAISRISDMLSSNLPQGSALAITNIASDEESLALKAIDEFEFRLVNSKIFTIVDRRKLDEIRKEQMFQMSGDVSDESIVRIGQMVGASIILTGHIVTISETSKRISVKALDVKTGQILAMGRLNF